MEPSGLQLNSLLKQVSRSFYLTLRVLPGAVRPQIGLAYLLARTTDTIADTDVLPVEQRLESLALLRGRILGAHRQPLPFESLARRQASEGERALLLQAEEALQLLERFSPADRQRIREVLKIITGGQELDLTRFSGGSESNLISLETEADLDDYTYRVAGCVGEFWTHVCRAHLFPSVPLDEAGLIADGIRFGKGLQLVNILRDIPRDLRQGRCYLPRVSLAQAGLKPEDLLHPGSEVRFRPLYNRWLADARDHLAAGWRYTNTLPRRGCRRIRLACAWPLLLGVGTLQGLATGNVLDPGERIKVSRAQVRSVLVRSLVRYPFPGWWRSLFHEAVGSSPLAALSGSAAGHTPGL